MTTPVVVLDRTTTHAPGLGGKGASLARMVAGGCPVPPVAVVGAEAYRRLLGDPSLAAFLSHLSAGTEPPDADAVDAAFLDAVVPDDLSAAIVEAAAALGPRVAVRSSGSSEDLPDQSFAGQYTSFLDVPTERDALLRAVRLVWASLWHPAPWAYRRAWGVPDADATMAVVLMAMVPAVEAGVVFTTDPGGADQMRIEVVEGLGESLVSGKRTPTAWLVPRDPDAPLPTGAPAHLGTLRSLAAALEIAEGVPLDIEWAWDGEQVWLVQSRPITVAAAAGDGFDTPVDDHELTSEGIGEMLPGVLPPLQWSVASFLVEEAFRTVLSSLGALPPDAAGPHAFVRRVRGRAALDLDLVKAAAATIPGTSEADIERQYFGEAAAAAPSGAGRHGRFRLLRRDLRAAAARRQARFHGDVVTESVALIRAAPPEPADLTDGELLALRLRLLHLGVRAMTAELGVAASAAAGYARLEGVLQRYLEEDEAARWAQRLTRGATLPPPPALTASRSVFAGPTWAEDGGIPPAVRGRVAPDDAVDHRNDLETALASDPRWRRTRILSGQFVDVRLHLLRRMIADAVEDLGRREHVKAAVLELGGLVRQVHLELGARLASRGLLARAEDVDLLDEHELRGALLGGREVAHGLLGRRRRWLATRQDDDLLPARFRGTPTPTAAPVPPGDRWTGLAASPGRFTGPAVVVTDPMHERPPAGSVIVARATDAAWSPLFVDAGAIVVERGGPLSHAAIVARELGVPAVLDVHGATLALGGKVVTVDGDQGVVVVHHDVAGRAGAGQAVAQ